MPNPLTTLVLAAGLTASPAWNSTPWVVAQDEDVLIAGTIAPNDSVFSVQCMTSTGTLWATYAASGAKLPDMPMPIHFAFGEDIELTDAWRSDSKTGLIITVTEQQVMLWIKAALEVEGFAVEAAGLPVQSFTTEGLEPAVEVVVRGCRGAAV